MQTTAPVIIAAVAERFGFTADELRGRGQSKSLATARNVAMLLCRSLTGASFPEVGRVFARDHSTVVKNVKRLALVMALDPRLFASVEGLRRRLEEREKMGVSA